MSQLQPPPPVETQILEFAKSRPAFTTAQLAAHCSASDWKRTNTLRALKRRGVIKPCGTFEGQILMTTHDPDQARAAFLAADPEADAALRSDALDQRLSTAQSDPAPTAAPTVPWQPETDQVAAIWDFTKTQIAFTKAQFFAQAVLPRHRLELIFRRWQNTGQIRYLGRKNGAGYFSAIDPEQIQRETRDKRLSPEGRIWSAMRIARIFTPVDLAATLSGIDHGISAEIIQKYCSNLAHYGYLRVLCKASRKSPARYQLIRNSGPLPPVQKRLSVLIDPNTDTIEYDKGARA